VELGEMLAVTVETALHTMKRMLCPFSSWRGGLSIFIIYYFGVFGLRQKYTFIVHFALPI